MNSVDSKTTSAHCSNKVVYRFIEVPASNLVDLSMFPRWTLYPTLIMLSINAGVSEEAGFRRYMQGEMERRYGPFTAIAFTSIVFWLAHLNHPGGMVLGGNTLYVVQNALQQVTVFQMGSQFETGELVQIFDLPGSETPTTGDLFGCSLYLVDARFDTPSGPDVAYEVTRIDRESGSIPRAAAR